LSQLIGLSRYKHSVRLNLPHHKTAA